MHVEGGWVLSKNTGNTMYSFWAVQELFYYSAVRDSYSTELQYFVFLEQEKSRYFEYCSKTVKNWKKVKTRESSEISVPFQRHIICIILRPENYPWSSFNRSEFLYLQNCSKTVQNLKKLKTWKSCKISVPFQCHIICIISRLKKRPWSSFNRSKFSCF